MLISLSAACFSVRIRGKIMDDIQDLIFNDGEFQAGIARKVLPYLSSRQKKGYTTGGLYYSMHTSDVAKGTLVIVHGFSEGMYKYREFIYYMVRLGYNCLIYEHRGHGRSVRVTEESTSIHIDDFNTYLKDLLSITQEVAVPHSGELPVYLYGHSMGGCIAALFEEMHPGVYSKLILSSPMLSLRLKGITGFMAHSAARLMCALGRAEEPVTVFSGKEKFENSCSTSRERWIYYTSVRDSNVLLKMSNPTYGWVNCAFDACRDVMKNAEKICIPVLVFEADKDSMVDNQSIEHFASCSGRCTLVRMPGTKHEIISSPSEVLTKYYSAISSFLN